MHTNDYPEHAHAGPHPEDFEEYRAHAAGLLGGGGATGLREPVAVRYVVEGESLVREATLSGDVALLWRLAVPGVYVGPIRKPEPGAAASALDVVDEDGPALSLEEIAEDPS